MATNKFKQRLKTNPNQLRVDNELNILDNLTTSETLTDSLYRTIKKVPSTVGIKSKLSFFDSITWYTSPIPTFTDLRVMFTAGDIGSILKPSHKLIRAVHIRLNSIKLEVANEYMFPDTGLYSTAIKNITQFMVSNMVLKFIVLASDQKATLWFKSLTHGGEFLKVQFDSKTNKIEFI